MKVFRVMLNGREVLMRSEEGDVLCGFIKNEYVLGRSEGEAVDKAKGVLLERLRRNPAIRDWDNSPITFSLEEVERGVAPWKLFSNEGFIFYKIEEPS